MKRIYQTPDIEVFEFEVENGFAASYSGNGEDYGDGGGMDWDSDSDGAPLMPGSAEQRDSKVQWSF